MNHLKLLLFPFALLYGIITLVRNKLYDWQFIKSFQPPILTICVGNLNTGGTGKTPHTEYLIQLFQNNYTLATLSRGYGRKTKGFKLISLSDTAQSAGDEPLQYFKKFPAIQVSVCEKRAAGIQNLIKQNPALNLILLDDAYQHRKVNPSLRILLTEYSAPFFKDYVLPAGNLREFRSNYKKADFIIITKTPQHLSNDNKREIIQRIKPLKHQKVFFSRFIYKTLYNWENIPIVIPDNSSIVLLSGIANPKPLYQYLSTKFSIAEAIYFKDHHNFISADLIKIKEIYNRISAKNKYIITTEKDYMRLLSLDKEIKQLQLPICYIPIEVDFSAFENNDFKTALLTQITLSQI